MLIFFYKHAEIFKKGDLNRTEKYTYYYMATDQLVLPPVVCN